MFGQHFRACIADILHDANKDPWNRCSTVTLLCGAQELSMHSGFMEVASSVSLIGSSSVRCSCLRGRQRCIVCIAGMQHDSRRIMAFLHTGSMEVVPTDGHTRRQIHLDEDAKRNHIMHIDILVACNWEDERYVLVGAMHLPKYPAFYTSKSMKT
eukprot:2098961-Amphidinium_carterae.4